MRNKFMIYAVMVTVLFTGISWTRFIGTANNSGGYSRTGSSWNSNTGSGWGGGGGGHK
jgi:hypothetical protein